MIGLYWYVWPKKQIYSRKYFVVSVIRELWLSFIFLLYTYKYIHLHLPSQVEIIRLANQSEYQETTKKLFTLQSYIHTNFVGEQWKKTPISYSFFSDFVQLYLSITKHKFTLAIRQICKLVFGILTKLTSNNRVRNVSGSPSSSVVPDVSFEPSNRFIQTRSGF